jgi:alkylated DNA repair dioxygenase AlkB
MSDGRLVWQPSLFGEKGTSEFDTGYASSTRHHLDASSWVDYAPRWVSDPDALFAEVADLRPWVQRTRPMFDRLVLEPRLTSSWSTREGQPLEPAIIERMRRALSARYGVVFDSVGFNLYRHGHDSVAWHGDRIAREISEPVVALVSLGESRPFLLRSQGGGRSRRFLFGGGDLLVTGGRTQREWQHSVPKVASAGPRISIAFRHGMESANRPGAVDRTPS